MIKDLSEMPIITIDEEELMSKLIDLENEYVDRLEILAEKETALDAFRASDFKINPLNYKAGDLDVWRGLVQETKNKIDFVNAVLNKDHQKIMSAIRKLIGFDD